MPEPLANWQQRVIKEKSDLDIKIGKLEAFIDDEAYNNLDEFNQIHLNLQLDAMILYSNTLGARIARFNP